MTDDLQLAGPTVTLFGDRDPLDSALSDELGRRGCSTHSVTIPMGWLHTATHAVLRVNTRSGEDALRALAHQPGPPSHVVAVCETTDDLGVTETIERLCRQCGVHHDVSLIWHHPFGATADDSATSGTTATMPRALAATIADEVDLQSAAPGDPSFAEQTYEPAQP